MRCQKQRPYYNRIPISNLWEVQLDIPTWNRIQFAAKEWNCSLTWITRYCLFRLARKKNLRLLGAMKIHSEKVKKAYITSDLVHRHIVCLYGDDEKLIRIAAMQLGVTVSHLIRLSLHWFLPKFEKGRITWAQLFYHGIKICRFLSVHRKNMLQIPFYDTIFYGKWTKHDWWGWPIYGINIPFTPDQI